MFINVSHSGRGHFMPGEMQTIQLTGENKVSSHVNGNCWEKTIPLGKCSLIFEITQNVLAYFQQIELKHFNYESFTQNISFHNKHNLFNFFLLFDMDLHSYFIQERKSDFDYVLCRLQDPVFKSALSKEPNGVAHMSICDSRKGRAAPEWGH